MNNPEPHPPTPVWKTIMWPAAALAITQMVCLLLITTDLLWYFVLLAYSAPLVIPLVALGLTVRLSKPAPPLSALLVLPVVLYATGIVSCIFVWWVGGAPPGGNPLASEAWKLYNVYGIYGVYGFTAGILWVGCLLRTWKHTHTAHRTKTRIED